MPTNVTFNGTTYAIPLAGELNWSALSNFLIDVGNHAGLSSFQKQNIRVATTSPVTVSATTDYCLVSNLSVAGAVTVNLPAGVVGQIFVVVDGKGDASTNNITISPNGGDTINGGSGIVLNHNREAVVLQFSTGNWNVVSDMLPSGTITPSDLSATPIPPAQGGTGIVNNNASTITISGAYPVALTATASTAVTLPVSGTLSTLAGVEQLTNKDIDGGTASDTSRITVPQDTLANISALTRKAGTLLYASDTQLMYEDNGTSLVAVGAGAPVLITANVRDPQAGGTVTLTNSDVRNQIFNVVGANVNVLLPTTGVNKGDVWQMVSANEPYYLWVKASDASSITAIMGGQLTVVALVNAPVASTDWAVVSLNPTYLSYWTTYSPTFGGATPSTSIVRYRRDFQDLLLRGSMTFSGAGTPGDFTVSLPPNLTIDLAKYLSLGNGENIGTNTYTRTSAGKLYAGTSGISSTTAIDFLTGYTAGASGGNEVVTLNPANFVNGDTFSFQARVSIVEFLN